MGVPYCIVKGKARLGTVVHKKTATALAIVDAKPEDKQELAAIVSAVKANCNSLPFFDVIHLHSNALLTLVIL